MSKLGPESATVEGSKWRRNSNKKNVRKLMPEVGSTASIKNCNLHSMCDKCHEIDKAIERYRRVMSLIGDTMTVSEAKKLLAEALDQKARLHPE